LSFLLFDGNRDIAIADYVNNSRYAKNRTAMDEVETAEDISRKEGELNFFLPIGPLGFPSKERQKVLITLALKCALTTFSPP